jgi:hypothetical protein
MKIDTLSRLDVTNGWWSTLNKLEANALCFEEVAQRSVILTMVITTMILGMT